MGVKEAYDRVGYKHGVEQGIINARVMKENADGRVGCTFEDTEEWEMPCSKCERNAKDYWRAKSK